MIREKIFRLHRYKSSSSSSAAETDASAQKFDFTFSNIQAIQVPKGWDKVSLSLITLESGKTVRKTGKVPVKNGTCQWTETFSESIWISDVDSSKEVEEYLFKFLVASGSSKSSILGEATLNLAAFLSSESPILVSVPMKKCNYGTILQVEVKCLTPKTNLRDEKWREMHANKEENADHDNIENQSDISDCTTAKSTESFSCNNVANSSRPRELSSRETSFSASVSRYSFDSIDDSVGRQSFSSQSDRNGGNNVILRQDSIESNDSASYCSYSTHGSIKSVRSLQGPFAKDNQSKNQREELRKLSNATASSLQQNGASSKTFKEADDAIVQELEAEARMWEQNARKLSVDVERLRKELSDQNVNMTNLNIELARSHSESHEFTQEIKRLKLLLEESSMKQSVDQNSEIQETAWSNIQKEMEDEIRFQKEENENLSLQLKKTQESNIEFISVLQEMETIDEQKLEIESLSIADTHEQIQREKNCILELELLNMQELQRTLKGEILVLESTLQDKVIETEIEQDLKNQVLKEFVVECNHRLAAKEEKIMNLEAALSRALSDENLKETERIGHDDVRKEIRQLMEKIQELESDCNELTEENLDLLFELKELRKNVSDECHHDSTSEVNKLELHNQQPMAETKTTEILQEKIADLEAESENMELLSQSFTVKDCTRDLELRKCHEKAEQASHVESGKSSDEGPNFNVQSQCTEYKSLIFDPDDFLKKAEKEIEDLSYHKIHVADEKIDESRLMEPENNQTELVKHLCDLQEENIYLSQRVSGLEAQLRYLTDKSESSLLELQHSESKVVIFESQIRRLEEEIELQKLDMKQKLLDMQKQCSEAEEECTALSKLNIKLQVTTESLIEEYNSLQKFNGEIREQKVKLQDHCLVLESEARKYRDSRCNCAENIGTLEVKYSLEAEAEKCYGCDNRNELESTADGERENLERSDSENEVVLAPNQEKLLIMFENMMNGESKHKSIINELESKIKLSELERFRLAEENSLLHMQLQKVPELQNEVLVLRISLRDMKCQNRLLEASFISMSGDYEELKCENNSLVEKMSSMQKAVSEAEDCRRKKNAVEEKILRLEGDLIARDALCVQDAEMKNELNRIKIANSQLLMKVKRLEDVGEDLQRRAQSLEQELKQTRHAEEIHSKSTSEFCPDNRGLVQPQVQVFDKQDSLCRRFQVPVMDSESRIQLLENELAKALKAKDVYKLQLESAQVVASKKSESTENKNTAETEHKKISLLEAELQEIRERYLQISLKYAEVEAQREQLVMKLRGLDI